MEKTVDSKAVAGVSIVEIMISLVLVALALIAVTTVFPNMAMHRKGIHEGEQAKMIAAEALEVLQYYEYTCNDVASDGIEEFKDKYGTSGTPIYIDMGSAKYKVKKENIICSGDIHTVDVVVSWKKGGKDHNIKVTGALR